MPVDGSPGIFVDDQQILDFHVHIHQSAERIGRNGGPRQPQGFLVEVERVAQVVAEIDLAIEVELQYFQALQVGRQGPALQLAIHEHQLDGAAQFDVDVKFWNIK